jgi:hypothetical protein
MGKIITLRPARPRRSPAAFVELWSRLEAVDQLAIEKAVQIVIVSRQIQQNGGDGLAENPAPADTD